MLDSQEVRPFERKMPEDMAAKKKRLPLSTRVLEETHAVLQVHAKKNGMTLGELAANVLDDYVVWLINSLKDSDRKKKR